METYPEAFEFPGIIFIFLWVAIVEVRKTPRYHGHEERMYFF